MTGCTARPSRAAASLTNRTRWAPGVHSRPAWPPGLPPFREPIQADKVRCGKAEKFAEHYSQATLFWNSQTPVEKAHILRGFRFELTRVQVPAIRRRVVAMLANVDAALAAELADSLGMEVPEPLPKALAKAPKPEVTVSSPLSLFARPGDGKIRTRRVAILVAPGVDGDAAETLHTALAAEGAVPRYVGPRLGAIETESGDHLDVEVTLEAMPSVLFDAVAVPGGAGAVKTLGGIGHALEFVRDQHRHAKPILALGAGADLLENAGVLTLLPSGEPDPGLLVRADGDAAKAAQAFVRAIARHRHHEREMDPPAA